MSGAPAASRHVAFLRAINVGKRRVKMDDLRQRFEAMGFERVATFIASGNVIFDAPTGDRRAMEQQIAAALETNLGFPVDTFVRRAAEVAAIAAAPPFGEAAEQDGATIHVAFLAEPPGEGAETALIPYRTESDHFALGAREAYWLCLTRMSDSAFSGALLEKALGQPATLRSLSTVRRIAATFC